MSLCKQITLDFDEEMINTRKMLERVPLDGGKPDFKPHPKSMAMNALATHLAEIPSWFPAVLEMDKLEITPGEKPRLAGSNAELLKIFDDAVKQGRAAIDKVSDEEMAKDWSFKYGDVFSMTQPRPVVVRGAMNHLVHHRAQLGVYLRLNGIAVPGMYGPSADEV